MLFQTLGIERSTHMIFRGLSRFKGNTEYIWEYNDNTQYVYKDACCFIFIYMLILLLWSVSTTVSLQRDSSNMS